MKEIKDMATPRHGWVEAFYYSYEVENSQRCLEGSRLNQAMRGERQGKSQRGARERTRREQKIKKTRRSRYHVAKWLCYIGIRRWGKRSKPWVGEV